MRAARLNHQLHRMGATLARTFARSQAASAGEVVPLVGAADVCRSDAEPSSGQRWEAGVAMFRRGEIAPANSDEADGWYWAENLAARGMRFD